MSRPDETNWRERRDRFFEARRAALEAEVPLPFHAVNVQPRGSYYIKNPCPECNPTGLRGGRMFRESNSETGEDYWLCYACGHDMTLLEWDKHLESQRLIRAQKEGRAKAKANGVTMGRPKSSSARTVASNP